VAVGPSRFRAVLRHVPTSVTVVAAATGEGPRGLSVGSFVPVSLEPPLVGFFVARTSTSWPLIEAVGGFCVSVLGEGQADVSSRFAVPGPDKFEGISWHEAPSGHPVIDEAVAWVDCSLEALHPAGDHVLVLGAVSDLGVLSGTTPLLHHGGGYRRAGDLSARVGLTSSEPDVASREPSSGEP
jgi:3-hydroxy-9,10-secoandrosta-1,3,5(10)-triene-9,17-dione monooxygenase reductase component